MPPSRIVQTPLTEEEKRTVEANMGLVHKIAGVGFRHSRLNVEDRIQAGMTGLMRAVQLYDPSKGALSTIATYWIRNAIQRAEIDGDPIKVPLWVRHTHADEREQAKAEKFHGDRDRAIGVAGGVCDDDVAGCGSSDDAVDDADESAWLMRRFNMLAGRQRAVLKARFWRGETYKQVGRRLGVSGEAVRLWEGGALARLKEAYDEEYAEGA